MLAQREREKQTQVPWQQVVLDDVVLLLLLGTGIPFLFYIIWGLMELSNLPVMR